MGGSSKTGMEQLWAPWRSTLFAQQRRRACIFCVAKRSTDNRRHHVIARNGQAFALLNRYPYNTGHLMVAPVRHVGQLEQLSLAEWTSLWRLSQRLVMRVRRTLHPHGFNIGLNLGRVGGAGIPGHLHVHVVPRWNGDTNFMPVLGATKVISQSLDALYALLAKRRRPSR